MEAGPTPGGTPNVRIAFIAGTSWSGSTLLEQAMAQIDGCVSIGELYWLWDPDWPLMVCECGAAFGRCEFWQAVLDEAYGSRSDAIRSDIRARGAGLLRHSIVPTLARSSSRFRPAAALRELGSMIEPVYRAVRSVSGGETIIDSSKCALWGLAISMADGVDMRVIHLVRDPTGFVASDRRRRELPYPPGATRPPRPAVRSLITWILLNLEAELLDRQVPASTHVLYEDVVEAPSRVARRVAGVLGTDVDFGRVFVDDMLVVRRVGHAIGGNPRRPRLGRTAIVHSDVRALSSAGAAQTLRVPLIQPLWERYRRSVRNAPMHTVSGA